MIYNQALVVNNLTKTYPVRRDTPIKAVDNVSFVKLVKRFYSFWERIAQARQP